MLNRLYIKKIFLFIIVIILGHNTYGQELSNDTVLSVPYKLDTLNVEALSLERLPFSSKILKYITVDSRSSKKEYKSLEESSKQFLKYEGKQIRNIKIKILKPLGFKSSDTCEIENKWYEKIGNSLHYPKRTKYIKKLLTIEVGDKVSSIEISDNERLIRGLSHINDATIFINPVKGEENLVDILLVCEDVFSLAIELKTDIFSEFEVETYHKNLFGRGHQILSSVSFDDDKLPRWGYSFGYIVKNISNSYISLGLSYGDNYEGKRLKFFANREFVTANTKLAGSLLVEKVKDTHKVNKEDKFELKDSINFINVDSWLGYAKKLNSEKLESKHLVFSLGYYGTFFSKRPKIQLDSTLFFIDRSYVLSSIALSRIKYYKTNFVYDLGKTEDIPKGYYANFTFGYESNNIGKYLYSGVTFNRTWFRRKQFEYFGTKFSMGTFYHIGRKGNRRNNTNFERGIMDIGMNSITKLYKLGGSRVRFFSDINYTIGFLRYPDDYIDLDEEIRGFRSDEVRGNQKLSLKLTQNTYLPYIVNGFRFSFFTFADAGIIGSNDDLVFNKAMYWGLGFGLKFNNDNLIFRTFSLRFAFYPKAPSDFRSFKVLMRSEKHSGFVDLEPNKPQIIDYR